MASDRAVRFLATLGSASTSRVLNLAQIANMNRDNPEYAQQPLFTSPIINNAFIMKQSENLAKRILAEKGRKLDAVLEKVARSGQSSLTDTEKQILLRASEVFKKRRS